MPIYQTDRGKLTMLLSDGMGSGKKANEDSRIVIELASTKCALLI